jgi:hypothetical protein
MRSGPELRAEGLLSAPHEDAAKAIARPRRERDLACQERDIPQHPAFFAGQNR